MVRGKNLTLKQKVQIILRIRLKMKDKEIASEFGVTRSRITQIRLYEQAEIETQYIKKNASSQVLKMLDRLVDEDEKTAQ